MVEQLTEKTLSQEERIQELEEEKNDLVHTLFLYVKLHTFHIQKLEQLKTPVPLVLLSLCHFTN